MAGIVLKSVSTCCSGNVATTTGSSFSAGKKSILALYLQTQQWYRKVLNYDHSLALGAQSDCILLQALFFKNDFILSNSKYETIKSLSAVLGLFSYCQKGMLAYYFSHKELKVDCHCLNAARCKLK